MFKLDLSPSLSSLAFLLFFQDLIPGVFAPTVFNILASSDEYIASNVEGFAAPANELDASYTDFDARLTQLETA